MNTWLGDEYGGRRAILYHPGTNSLHVGPPGSTHGDVARAALKSGYPLRKILNRHSTDLYQGWTGWNPEAGDSSSVADLDASYGWYGPEPGPHVDAALAKHFDAQKDDGSFDFERLGAALPRVIDVDIPGQHFEGDPDYVGRRAVIYHRPTDTLYRAPMHAHHGELRRFMAHQYGIPTRHGTGEMDHMADGSLKNYGAVDYGEEYERIKRALGATDDDPRLDFEHLGAVVPTAEWAGDPGRRDPAEAGIHPVVYDGTSLLVGHDGLHHQDLRNDAHKHYVALAHPARNLVEWFDSGSFTSNPGTPDNHEALTAEVSRLMNVPLSSYRGFAYGFESRTANVRVHEIEYKTPDEIRSPLPPRSLAMIYDNATDTLHVGAEDEVHHADMFPHVDMGTASPGYIDLASRTHQWYDPRMPDKDRATELVHQHLGYPSRDADQVFDFAASTITSAPPEIAGPHPLVYWPHANEVRIGQPHDHHEDVEVEGPMSASIHAQPHRAIVRPGAIDWLYDEPPADHHEVARDLTYHYGQPFESTNGDIDFERFSRSGDDDGAHERQRQEEQRQSVEPVLRDVRPGEADEAGVHEAHQEDGEESCGGDDHAGRIADFDEDLKSHRWVPPILYTWMEPESIHDFYRGARRGVYLTKDGDIDNLNPDVPRFDAPVRMAIDTRHLDPAGFGADETEGYAGDPGRTFGISGNTYYRGAIPREAIIESRRFEPAHAEF